MNKTAVYRKEHFNAAHRLFVPEWDEARNMETFGKCSLPNYHGHNYEVVVRVAGIPDPKTGFVVDLKELSELIRREVLERFDHKNLNLDTEEFRTLIPTAENIAKVIYDLLRPHIPADRELGVQLYETERNFVSYPA